MDEFALALRVIFSLAVVLGVLWIVQRRYASASGLRGKAADPLTVVSRRGIGQKSALVVVDMGGKRFMLGVTDQNINVLHSEAAPEPAAVPETSGQAFSRTLASLPGMQRQDESVVAKHRGQPKQPGILEGSILAPSTWARAGQAFVKGSKG